MPRLVPDYGSKSARLVLTGEAPGRDEDRFGAPCVGSAGRMLCGDWLKELDINLKREDFYITNLYPYRPPANNITLIPRVEIAHWQKELHKRLAELEDPWLIIPTGSYALQALLKNPKAKITDYRGSILKYWDLNGRKVKMIPTLHPASAFYHRANVTLCMADWKRIAQEQHTRKLNLPQLNLEIHPTVRRVEEFAQECERYPEAPLAVDIETNPRERKILMIGFALRTNESITIPWRKEFMEVIRRLCGNANPKVMQFGQYDV